MPEVFAGPSLGPGVGFADTPATVFDASGVEVSALRRATVFDASGVGVSFAPGRLQPTVFDAYDVGASIPMSRLLHIRFSIPADTRPELELFAVGLMRALTSDSIDCEITRYADENSGVISGRSRSVDGLELEFSIHAQDRQSWVALVLNGQERAMLALVIQAGLVERIGSGGNALRVLFSGVKEFDRRMKMTARTITELRRRRHPAIFMAVGELPEAMIRLAPPDHHFPRIDGRELQELLGGCDVVLECVDADEPRTALSCLAESAGIPVVVHRTAAGAQVVRTDEWSADGFCDALTLPVLALADRNGTAFENTYSTFKGALGFAQD